MTIDEARAKFVAAIGIAGTIRRNNFPSSEWTQRITEAADALQEIERLYAEDMARLRDMLNRENTAMMEGDRTQGLSPPLRRGARPARRYHRPVEL